MKQNKIKTSFTLSKKAKRLIDILANKLEISKTAIITLAILHFAESKGIEIEDNETF